MKVQCRCKNAAGPVVSEIRECVLELLDKLEDEVDVGLCFNLDNVRDVFANGFVV